MNLLPAETLTLVARLQEDESAPDEVQTGQLLKQSDSFLLQTASVLESAQRNGPSSLTS